MRSIHRKVGRTNYLKAYRQKLWQGEDVSQKTLLVHGEQGLGDEIFFLAALPQLLTRARRVIVECEPRLTGLLQRSFPTLTVSALAKKDVRESRWARDESVDFHVPAGSLMRWLGSEKSVYPMPGGSLRADPVRRAAWRSRLDELDSGLKIGIAWRSLLAGMHIDDAKRVKNSTDLKQWQQVLSVPGVRWVSLQYGHVEKEIQEVARAFGLPIARWPEANFRDDLESLAALISELDVVIAIPTASAFLAAAVGTEVWMLSTFSDAYALPPVAADPLLAPRTIFRQVSPGAWEDVFAALAERLKARVSGHNQD